MPQQPLENHALVTGAHGLVGLNIAAELKGRSGWRAVAVGRRPDPPINGLDYVAADLLDAEQTRAAVGGRSTVTHLFFGAYQYSADPYEEIAANVTILSNTLDALKAAGAPLKRVIIFEGSKAYGALIGPMKTPAKESDPRVPGPLFYFDQEDLLLKRGAVDGFAMTVMRPDFIAGIGFGSYVNLVNVIAVYATVCKALGLPLYFPGGPVGYNALFQMTDARLLARGSIWAASADGADNLIYNIANGDLFRWANVWPRIARYFGLEPGPPMTIDLKLFMRDKAALWSELAAIYGLTVPFERFGNWDHASVLALPHDVHTSTIRIRNAGFHDCLDSEDRLFDLFEEMRKRKIIPAA